MTFEAFALSDPGCVRSNNEDYFISDSESGIFILADGMGGANAGEYAARLSAETLYEFLLDPANRDAPEALERGFLQVNATVREAAGTNPDLEGMGTTLLVARVTRNIGEGCIQISSVGDSRAYLCSNGDLSLLTEDQTWVAEVGARLGLSDDALKKHPMRHVLTMAVGSSEDLRVFSRNVEMKSSDQILLCSDGLHGVLTEKTLGETLHSEKTLPEKCHYLVEAAKSAGGPDNVTVVLIQLV
ncbi:MAG TPA: protein phosphatase 2C domain-containing protein [Bryobacteraceae bacterium]